MRSLIDGSPPRQVAPSLGQLRSQARKVLEVCRHNGVSNVWVFGSIARGEQDAESDLDLVVDFEEGRSLFDLAGLVDELESLLGCPVNVVSQKSLRDNTFGRAVKRDMVPL